MSKIFIVSKTKMANDHVCVGGIDLDTKMSVRLLDINGYHEMREECPYQICEVWEIEYISSPRPLPHSEDTRVSSRKRTGILKQELSMLDILKRSKFNIYSGSIMNCFEGKFKCTNSGSLYISQEDIPNHSTCFWVCDRNLVRNGFDKIRYRYQDGTRQLGYNITYVGLEENPANIIPKDTLIRLSLAHWWLHEGEEKCFLQLSGWY
jgi:hypothetical protein